MGGSSPLLLVDVHNNNFYSLGENKVVSLGGGDATDTVDAVIVGSSHGWLALMTRVSLDLFLWNPISRRRVDLPSIHHLCIPADNLEGGFGCVEKLVLSSSSPGDADCRAALSYGPARRLAFCCPGHSADWIAIGAWYEHPEGYNLCARVYHDFAFSARRNRLFCITRRPSLQWEFECWDLEDPFSPTIDEPELEEDDEPELQDDDEPELQDDDDEADVESEDVDDEADVESEDDDDEADVESEDDDDELRDYCTYLVVADEDHSNHDQLFMVVRAINREDHYLAVNYTHPNKTADFDVYKIVKGDGGDQNVKFVYVESLDGLSMFVGINQCFALSAAEFPDSDLRPDSIYFTDPTEERPQTFNWWSSSYGLGQYDIGIFDYINKAFHPSYSPPTPDEPEPEPGECYGEDLPLIVWFTPRS